MSARLRAAKAVLTGRLPVVEKEVVKTINFRVGQRRKKEVSRGRLVNSSTAWTDKIPHPPVMAKLDEINEDPDVDSAITLMTEMIASSFFTEMREEVPKNLDSNKNEVPHPNKKKLDEWCEKHRADENIKMAVREALEKGFFVIDCDPDDDFEVKVLPSDSMYMWRKPTEKKPYKFTQEFGGIEVDTWEGADLKRIIWWAHKETPINPYGKALAYCFDEYIDARREMTRDGNAVLHRLGYPDRRFEAQSKEVIDKVFTQYTSKLPEETLFLDGIAEGDLREVTADIKNVRINFEGFQTCNDTRITNGLCAPSMSTLRNSTEASATKMLEFFENYSQGVQFSLKRLLENSLFSKVVSSGPVPRLVWGRKKTGLEKWTGTDIAALYNGGNGAITFDQAQDLLKKLGLPLKDLAAGAPAPGAQVPALTNLPAVDPARMQTIQASLDVIEKNYKAKNIDIADAFKEGARVIRVHIDALRKEMLGKLHEANKDILQLSPESERYFQVLGLELSARFREKTPPNWYSCSCS